MGRKAGNVSLACVGKVGGDTMCGSYGITLGIGEATQDGIFHITLL